MAPVIVPDPNYRKNVEHFCLKKIYSSKHEADHARNHAVKRSGKGRDPLKIIRAQQGVAMAYFCERCQGWHWGHSNSFSRRSHLDTPQASPGADAQTDGAPQNRSV